jgi:hypothetical protein
MAWRDLVYHVRSMALKTPQRWCKQAGKTGASEPHHGLVVASSSLLGLSTGPCRASHVDELPLFSIDGGREADPGLSESESLVQVECRGVVCVDPQLHDRESRRSEALVDNRFDEFPAYSASSVFRIHNDEPDPHQIRVVVNQEGCVSHELGVLEWPRERRA